MKLFTEEQERRLLAQGRANAGREESEDFKPVVKRFCHGTRPRGSCPNSTVIRRAS